MKEQLSPKEQAVVQAEIKQINKCLSWPKSLHSDTKTAFFEMASGMVDESGGGSVHDVDYYSFPAKALNEVILGSGEADVKGFHHTDMVDWSYGRVDGSESHGDRPVNLHLALKKRDDFYIFIISERESDLPPQIDDNGSNALTILERVKERTKYEYEGMVYSFLGDPTLLDLGNLNDLDIPCRLVFDDYLTPETSSDGDYSEERKRILYFDKAMVIEALTKLKPGEKITVKGPGRAIHFLERAGYGYNHNENTVEINKDVPVDVIFSVTYFPDKSEVVFDFDALSWKPADLDLPETVRVNNYVTPQRI